MARILIIEDETVVAQSIQFFLAASEHQLVGITDSGIEAIHQAQDLNPDLILMDIYLRGEIDGITAAEQIYQQWGIPIIYLSGTTEDTTLKRAIASQPFGYLVKPFDQTQLLTIINIALHRSGLEKQLEQTEQWLATTLSSIGDGTIATDPTGVVTFMNPMAEVLTGWQQTEALGTAIHQVLQLLDPDTHQPIANPLLQAIQAGDRVTLAKACILRTKDGRERAIRDTATPIRNNKGEIMGGVLVFQDVTERKQAEALLHRREQEFRALVENSPDIVARFDRQLRHLYVNSTVERITGIPRAAFIGRTNRELGMPAANVNLWDACLHHVFETGQEQTIAFDAMTLDGVRFFQSRLVPEFAQDGTVATVLAVARDISDRKQIEEALRLQAEREQLLGTLTQRIRESLEVETLLNTAVQELRQILHADRVVVYRFEPNWSGFVIVESLAPGWSSMLGHEIYDPCLATEACLLPLTRGQPSIIHDIATAGLAECYVALLQQFQIQANLVIPILHGDQLWGLLAVQQCATPRTWQEWEIDFLTRLSHKLSLALQQSQFYQHTQLQMQRQQALNRVIQSVRNSLDVSIVFETAVAEIGQLLQVDQAHIIQYFATQQLWVHQASYCRIPAQQRLSAGLEIPDDGNPQTAQLKQGQIVRIDNAALLEDEFSQILAETFPGAWLSIPLHVNGYIWGSVSLIHHHQPFVWQDWQVELTAQIADQLAIAIYQSQLFTEVQRLNAELESQVLERTALLQRALNFEALLKRITDKVRDSLDENQILQAAVQELGAGLGVIYCSAALYNHDQTIATITHEFLPQDQPPSPHRSFPLTGTLADSLHTQLWRQEYCQFCFLEVNPVRPMDQSVTILACSVWDDQGVLGDLWLQRPAAATFDDSEIRLVQQVANQCAIALRQSRLFQAAQTQVLELERLNQLKDDFLSTISHELRTPMASIKMAIQMLEIALAPLGVFESHRAIGQYFEILQTACNREIGLIDDLLKLSQLEAETEPLILSAIAPDVWLRHAAEPFMEQMQAHQQALTFAIASPLPPLHTDLSCLGRILAELLTNACKYSPADSAIEVFAFVQDQHLHLGVSNTGVEIAPAEQARIFEKFYRIPNQDPWRYGGTGIGLALVKKLVNHIGGEIMVTSQTNQTTFTIVLPLTLS